MDETARTSSAIVFVSSWSHDLEGENLIYNAIYL